MAIFLSVHVATSPHLVNESMWWVECLVLLRPAIIQGHLLCSKASLPRHCGHWGQPQMSSDTARHALGVKSSWVRTFSKVSGRVL